MIKMWVRRHIDYNSVELHVRSLLPWYVSKCEIVATMKMWVTWHIDYNSVELHVRSLLPWYVSKCEIAATWWWPTPNTVSDGFQTPGGKKHRVEHLFKSSKMRQITVWLFSDLMRSNYGDWWLHRGERALTIGQCSCYTVLSFFLGFVLV